MHEAEKDTRNSEERGERSVVAQGRRNWGWLAESLLHEWMLIGSGERLRSWTYVMKNGLDSFNVVLVQEQLVHKRRRSDVDNHNSNKNKSRR